MTNTKYKFSIITLTLLFTLIVSLLTVQQTLAQGGGSGGGSGSGDQTQDRDRIQDPTTHDGDEPIQDRDQDKLQDRDQTQDRDRIQDLTTHDGDEPIQDRDQLRDRLRDQLEDPDQDRDRDRIRANDSAGLQQVISASEEVSDDITNGFGEEARELTRNRNRVQVGVMALLAAQNMIGQNGQQVSNMAQEIGNAHQLMTHEEEQIRSQSWFSRFFFGGDTESAQAIRNRLQQNEQLIQQIRQHLDNSSIDEPARNMLQEQIRNIEEEHERLGQVADEATSQWGLFSWRF